MLQKFPKHLAQNTCHYSIIQRKQKAASKNPFLLCLKLTIYLQKYAKHEHYELNSYVKIINN